MQGVGVAWLCNGQILSPICVKQRIEFIPLSVNAVAVAVSESCQVVFFLLLLLCSFSQMNASHKS